MPPKVTVRHEAPDTPSESIVKAANKLQSVTANGRTIGLKKMQALDRLKMFEVIGPDNSKNEPYLGYAVLAFHVASIDGEAVNRPATKLQLEALIQRLGDEGMEAIGESLQQMLANQLEAANQLEPIKN